MENIENDILYESYLTPIHLKHKFYAHNGTAFGLSHKLNQTTYFRPHIKDENIKGLIEISKRVDIRIKLQKKEISLYDLIKKLNLNIEEDNIDKHTMIKYDYKNFIVKLPYTKHITNIKHTIYKQKNKKLQPIKSAHKHQEHKKEQQEKTLRAPSSPRKEA